MAIQCFIHACACDMLGIKELPLDLRNYLDDIEAYANLMGGTIQSRQVIGAALVTYIDNKKMKEEIQQERKESAKMKEEIQQLKKDIINISTILMKEDMKKAKPPEEDKELHDRDWSYVDPDDYPEGNYKGEF